MTRQAYWSLSKGNEIPTPKRPSHPVESAWVSTSRRTGTDKVGFTHTWILGSCKMTPPLSATRVGVRRANHRQTDTTPSPSWPEPNNNVDHFQVKSMMVVSRDWGGKGEEEEGDWSTGPESQFRRQRAFTVGCCRSKCLTPGLALALALPTPPHHTADGSLVNPRAAGGPGSTVSSQSLGGLRQTTNPPSVCDTGVPSGYWFRAKLPTEQAAQTR